MGTTLVSPSGSGPRFLNMVSDVAKVGYLPTFNYLDGQVDFNSSEINNNSYDLGYALTKDRGTHFNGFNTCDATFSYTPNSDFSEVTKAIVRNFCYIKTKYISISGSSSSIYPTITIPPSQMELSPSNSYDIMVRDSIPNVKYFLTSAVQELGSSISSAAAAKAAGLGALVTDGNIFPIYFPKRDTLVLKGDKLDRG
jgi:hypothetical protein